MKKDNVMFENYINTVEDKRNISILTTLFCILSAVVFVGIVYDAPNVSYTLSMFAFATLAIVSGYKGYLTHEKLQELKETKAKIDKLI